MQNIILILVCVIFGFIAVCAFLMAHAEKKEKIRIEKEYKEVCKNAEKTAEIITEANKTKADARTGNHRDDFNFMAEQLHHYAGK